MRSTRLVSFTQRAVAAICYEVEPLDGAGPDDRAVRAGRQRGAARDRATTRGWPPCSRRRWSRGAPRQRRRRPAGAPHQGQRPADGRGDGPRRRRPGRHAVSTERHPGLGPHHRRLRARSPGRRCGWSSCSPTAGPAERSLPALRDQVGAALAARPARRLGRAARRRSASTSTTFWDAADVEVEGDPEVQQAVRFGLFHVLQAGARAERRPIPAKGLTGPGYDGHTLLGHRDVRAAGAHLHPARRRPRTCCAGGTPPSTSPGSAPPTSGCTGAAFPWRTIRGQECSALLAGRHRRLPRQRRHRRRRPCATSRPPATTRSSARSGWSCWWRPPGCGVRWATTTGTAGSTSTGSPAPTSTPRSSTTTSTPTSWPSGTCSAPPRRCARLPGAGRARSA